MKPGSIPKPLTIPPMPKVAKAKAEPEVEPISYQDCANAMMKMWIDNVITDGEYNRIMDKLNAHWMSQEDKDDRT